MVITFPWHASGVAPLTMPQTTPERRRVVVIGAGAAGLTAALHIGEHSVLLEQRSQVSTIYMGDVPEGGDDDCKSGFPLGVAGAGITGAEDGGADSARTGVSAWERQEIARACAPSPQAQQGEPVVVARWVPPQLDATRSPSTDEPARESLQSLVPLLRGELRLDSRVSRIAPAARRVELADGSSIVYDKLASSISSSDLIELLQPELPDRIRSHQGLMYWLAARDIELLDESTQFLYGDTNPFAAGRRVAESIKRALAQKFRPATDTLVRGERLFKPRLVGAPSSAGAR